ncbi:MAG: hypothetical protein AABZ33_07960 [Chloroflexota bacterium]
MTTRIEVDFNSRDAGGALPALIADADGSIRVGDIVESYDLEGYRCPAIVARVSEGIVALDPLWRAFAAPNEPRIVLTRPVEAMWAGWTNRLTVTFSRATVIVPPNRPRTSSREQVPA